MMAENKKDKSGIFTTLIRMVRYYFRNERSREVLSFLFFVALSFLFWVLQSLSEDMNISYRIPIKYTNVPDNTIFTNELPSHITLHLRDEGGVLLNYNLEGIPAFEVDFLQYANNRNAFIIPPEQISAQIKKNLKNTTNLTSMSIDTLAVYYTQGVGKKVKVIVEGEISTLPQYIVNGRITTNIDSIQIYAPDYLLNRIDEVKTETFSAENLSETWVKTVPLRKQEGIKMVPEQVTVTIPVEEFTTKSLTIPVSVENLPARVSLLTFPASVQVDCVIPMSQFSQVSEKDVRVAVNYKDTQDTPSKLAVRVVRSVGEVLKIYPDSVEYILEQK